MSEQPQPTTPKPPTNAQSTIEMIGKAVVPVTLALYVIGYLTHAAWFVRLGVPTSEVIRPQYIAAGVWVLVPLALLIAILLLMGFDDAVARRWMDRVVRLKRRPIARTFLTLILSMVLAFAVQIALWFLFGPALAVVGPRFGTVGGGDFLARAGWTGAVAAVLVIAIFRFKRNLTLRRAATTPDETDHFTAKGVMCLLFAVAALVGYIALFAAFFFPLIPVGLGGGRPLPVRFILRPVTATPTTLPTTAPTTLPSPLDILQPDPTDQRYTDRRGLYLVTDKEYVVYGPKQDGSSSFDRSLVDGYLVDPKE